MINSLCSNILCDFQKVILVFDNDTHKYLIADLVMKKYVRSVHFVQGSGCLLFHGVTLVCFSS